MNQIAGIPYVEARFKGNGTAENTVTLPPGVTDLLVMSHGWNNDEVAANALYQAFFSNFAAVGAPDDLPGRTLAIIGVIWPSKRWDARVAVDAGGDATGAAGIGASDAGSRAAIEAKLESMKELFTEPPQRATLDEAKALVPDLDEKGSARRAFVEKIRSLLDKSAGDKEDASDDFLRDDGDELMQNLRVTDDDLDEEIAGTGGGASLPLGVSAGGGEGGAAGLKDVLKGFKASAMNVLNFTTYYEMKARAGKVGANGVAKLIDSLAPQVQRIHLIGHSFGGRVVTAAAAASTTDKIRSLNLLQTAFSHNGFSKSEKGFFRSVVDQQRVRGPILVTHTKNDKAVGAAYPLASRIVGDRAAALGDENDVFGGLGRNGALHMESGETVAGKLLPTGGQYAFQPGKFFNLEASAFIPDHGGVTGKEVAYAVRRAVAG